MSTMYGSVKVVSAPSPSHAHAVDGERKEVSPGQLEAFGVEGGVKEAQMEVYNQQSLHPVGQGKIDHRPRWPIPDQLPAGS